MGGSTICMQSLIISGYYHWYLGMTRQHFQLSTQWTYQACQLDCEGTSLLVFRLKLLSGEIRVISNPLQTREEGLVTSVSWGVVWIMSKKAYPLCSGCLLLPCVRMRCRGKAMLSRVCVCVCVGQKKIKNASSRVARTFKDIILNEKQPVISYWNVLYLTQGSSFHCYFSYFLLLVSWLHPFWNRTWYWRSANAQENIHEYTLVFNF